MTFYSDPGLHVSIWVCRNRKALPNVKRRDLGRGRSQAAGHGDALTWKSSQFSSCPSKLHQNVVASQSHPLITFPASFVTLNVGRRTDKSRWLTLTASRSPEGHLRVGETCCSCLDAQGQQGILGGGRRTMRHRGPWAVLPAGGCWSSLGVLFSGRSSLALFKTCSLWLHLGSPPWEQLWSVWGAYSWGFLIIVGR